jgi:DNA-binding CsgD family transcriptional regulator
LGGIGLARNVVPGGRGSHPSDDPGRENRRKGEGLVNGDRADPELRLRAGATALLALVALGGVVDLLLDAPSRTSTFHVAYELAFIALCLGGIAFLWRGWALERTSHVRTEADLARRAAERDDWRARAETLLRGLGEEIEGQLTRWGLTPAERETALLLLKGYGHKEAAALLGKSERTVRQQAIAVYRKSGLAGRAELAAFFLEDLLLPASCGGEGDVSRLAASEAKG